MCVCVCRGLCDVVGGNGWQVGVEGKAQIHCILVEIKPKEEAKTRKLVGETLKQRSDTIEPLGI